MDNGAIDCREYQLELRRDGGVCDLMAAADSSVSVWLELGHFNHEIVHKTS